jgi:hypothetical protein
MLVVFGGLPGTGPAAATVRQKKYPRKLPDLLLRQSLPGRARSRRENVIHLISAEA